MPIFFDGSEIEGLVCFDHSEMYVQSESISETFGSVKLSYEHCIETSTIEDGCADQNTTEEFWKRTQFFVQLDLLRVDMEQTTDPLQDFRKFYRLNTVFNLE